MKNFILSWGFLIAAAFLDGFTMYVVKWRSNMIGQFEPGSLSEMKSHIIHFLNHPLLWIGVITFTLGIFLGYIAVTRMELTISYPASVGFHVIVIFLLATILLNESVSIQKLVGVALIMIGTWLLSKL